MRAILDQVPKFRPNRATCGNVYDVVYKIRNIYSHVLAGAPEDMAVNISYLVYSRYYIEYHHHHHVACPKVDVAVPTSSSQVFVYLTGMSECRPVHRTMLHNKNS